MDGQHIPWKKVAKYLRVIIDDKLNFRKHCQEARRKAIWARAKLHSLLGRKSALDRRYKLTSIRATIPPILMYSWVTWGHVAKSTKQTLQLQENISMRSAVDEPSYVVRNKVISGDLEQMSITETMKVKAGDAARAAGYEQSRREKQRRRQHYKSKCSAVMLWNYHERSPIFGDGLLRKVRES